MSHNSIPVVPGLGDDLHILPGQRFDALHVGVGHRCRFDECAADPQRASSATKKLGSRFQNGALAPVLKPRIRSAPTGSCSCAGADLIRAAGLQGVKGTLCHIRKTIPPAALLPVFVLQVTGAYRNN